MILFDEPAPRVFAVPPGADFARVLASGLRERLRHASPEAAARVRLILNTRRAARTVVAALEDAAEAEGGAGTAAFLPRVGTLDELDDPALAPPEALALPPAIRPMRARLWLARMVSKLLAHRPLAASPAAAPALADALLALLAEMRREACSLDDLDGLAPVEHAAHWDELLRFLDILRGAWPAFLAEEEALDPEDRRLRLVEATEAAWAAAPPQAPMILAGSTGSVGVTARLMRAISRAPQGALVLPGFDPEAAAEVWDQIDETHPYAGFRRLLDGLDVPPRDVLPWDSAASPAPSRRRLMLQALRPAPATDGWLASRDALAADAPIAAEGLTLIEAPDPRREAVAIALAIREALETPEGARAPRIALVTPDRTLARRVSAALARWGIDPDDSGGRPLGLTPPGVFLKLLARAAFERFDPVSLLALLKHPLMRSGEGRGDFLLQVRRFETEVLRRRPDLNSLAAALEAWESLAERREREAEEEDVSLVDDARPRLRPRPPVEEPPLLADTLAALAALSAAPGESLAEFAADHLDAAEALAPALWEKEAGEAARAAVDALREAAPIYGPCARREYPSLLAAALSGEAREGAFRPDPRVLIWGVLEARTQSADLVILGGLNEGVWPASPEADPWLSREMRAALGLPPAERRAGLAAHDFLVSACAPRAILTRSLRSEGSPTTASRLLVRLTTLLAGVAGGALDEMRARGARLLALVDPLERGPEADEPRRAPRPAPRPPVQARPRSLGASEVETLIRDPYAVYARHVLRLRPLPPVGREVDARDRGVVLHDVLHAFGLALREAPDAPLESLFERAAEAVGAAAAPEALRRLWRARLSRLRETFLREEAARLAAARPAGFELKGERRAPERNFTLTARADRVDRREDGSFAIYDYKTGGIPSDNQVLAFAQQLPLTAAIAEAGGFPDAGPAPVSDLAYLSLSGGKTGGETRRIGGEPRELAEQAWEKLLMLIEAFDRSDQPYLSRARPRTLREAGDGDYDHLARVGAWSSEEEA